MDPGALQKSRAKRSAVNAYLLIHTEGVRTKVRFRVSFAWCATSHNQPVGRCFVYHAFCILHSAFVIFFSERQAAYRMRMKIHRVAIKHACILRRRLFVRCVVRTIGREEGFVTHGMEIYQNNENQRRS